MQPNSTVSSSKVFASVLIGLMAVAMFGQRQGMVDALPVAEVDGSDYVFDQPFQQFLPLRPLPESIAQRQAFDAWMNPPVVYRSLGRMSDAEMRQQPKRGNLLKLANQAARGFGKK